MNKKEMINNVIDLYDEIEQLKKENETFTRYTKKEINNTSESTFSNIDHLMIEKGKEEVLRDAMYSWKEVECTYDEETDTYKVTSYISWLNKKVRRDSIPDEISFEEFKIYFREELQSMYEKEKTKALNEAKEIENVEEE